MNEENQEYFLYCLLLEEDRYYIGITNNIERRFKRHKKGKGALFTKKYKPLKIIFSQSLGNTGMINYLKMETQATINLMSLVGCHCVRGGDFIFLDDRYQYNEFINLLKKNRSNYIFPQIWLNYSFNDFMTSTNNTTDISFKTLLNMKF